VAAGTFLGANFCRKAMQTFSLQGKFGEILFLFSVDEISNLLPNLGMELLCFG